MFLIGLFSYIITRRSGKSDAADGKIAIAAALVQSFAAGAFCGGF
jgi:hypothetical protein